MAMRLCIEFVGAQSHFTTAMTVPPETVTDMGRFASAKMYLNRVVL